jgi:hypothetical protein
MQTGAITHTLLEAHDIRLGADFRDAPARPRPAPPRAHHQRHDFLVQCAHPDLTPDFSPAAGTDR